MSINETHIQTLELRVKNDQDEIIIEISYKISTYEDRLEKISSNKKQLQPLALQVKNEKYEKITNISYKLSTYEDRLEKIGLKT